MAVYLFGFDYIFDFIISDWLYYRDFQALLKIFNSFINSENWVKTYYNFQLLFFYLLQDM